MDENWNFPVRKRSTQHRERGKWNNSNKFPQCDWGLVELGQGGVVSMRPCGGRRGLLFGRSAGGSGSGFNNIGVHPYCSSSLSRTCFREIQSSETPGSPLV